MATIIVRQAMSQALTFHFFAKVIIAFNISSVSMNKLEYGIRIFRQGWMYIGTSHMHSVGKVHQWSRGISLRGWRKWRRRSRQCYWRDRWRFDYSHSSCRKLNSWKSFHADFTIRKKWISEIQFISWFECKRHIQKFVMSRWLSRKHLNTPGRASQLRR